MKELSSLEKLKLPFSLLLDPQTQRAAAYTNNHQLVTELASARLIEFALANKKAEQHFDAEMHAEGMKGPPYWRPLPDWMTPEVQERLLLIWIARPDGDAPDEAWRAIPKK